MTPNLGEMGARQFYADIVGVQVAEKSRESCSIVGKIVAIGSVALYHSSVKWIRPLARLKRARKEPRDILGLPLPPKIE